MTGTSVPLTMGTHVMIINQHGDNRGDEAALRGMLDGLTRRIPGARFTVVHQFADPSSSDGFEEFDIEWLPMRISYTQAARLAVYATALAMRQRPRWVLSANSARIVAAYESADLVISAPGGPYFGDLYRGHEPAHWFLVWLAALHRRTTVLYAPSAGPFDFRPWNPWRRFTYRKFDLVTLREERSAAHVAALMGTDFPIEVTADAALQHQLEPQEPATRFTIVVSALRPDRTGDISLRRRDDYDDAVVAAVQEALQKRAGARVILVPQLHGTAHRDQPYLEALAQRLPPDCNAEVLSEFASSNEHRRLIGSSHLVIAGRYHPAVFAIAAGVPVVCIPYEHKARGLMELAGAEDAVIPIEEFSPDRARATVTMVLDRESAVREHLRSVAPLLQARSARTSDLVVDTWKARRASAG